MKKLDSEETDLTLMVTNQYRVSVVTKEELSNNNVTFGAKQMSTYKNAAYQGTHRAGNAVLAWSELDAIQQVYRISAELTESTGIQHNVDHDIPLNGKNVSGLHVLANLKILTAEENVAKSNNFS